MAISLSENHDQVNLSSCNRPLQILTFWKRDAEAIKSLSAVFGEVDTSAVGVQDFTHQTQVHSHALRAVIKVVDPDKLQ